GAIKLGNDPVMYITVDKQVQRFYWKSRTFDTYDKGSWTAYRGLRVNADNLNFQYPTLDPATRTTVTQSVTMAIGSSRLVYTAPQPAEVRLPAQVEMDFLGDPRTADVGVIRPQQPIPEAAPYEVVSTVSTPTVAQLEADEGPYPTWIQRDLDLPNTVTNRTRGRAQDILRAANAVTRYEKARAIEIWLRSNIKYSESISLPPQNQDPVDWLLFDKKEGYCTYYASAMVVMLRTVGVPARIAAGFAQGQNEPGTQVYTVRERDAHTWVEVYFPKAGWVEFEPTSAQMPLDRPPPRVEPRTPSPSPTFTPSATPTFTPTPTTANGQTNRPPPTAQPTVTPTVLPTATPTLAPSPVVSAPPSPPILSRVVRNFLWVVLILLGAIAVLSVVGVGLLWWVEYRGLDRLSPAARGYARLAIYARWLRIPIDDSNTPMERGRRIAKEVPTGNRPVNTLTDLYIAERYAPPGRTGKKPIEEEQRIQSLWRAARRAFLQSKFRRWFHRE
ncbi:MAG TPA: transglutaminase domain-containing protein, partial [Aggregatilineales bacterium]|nr:transglutaminase domain-containing protein [Aggregatilineales bacterium]